MRLFRLASPDWLLWSVSLILITMLILRSSQKSNLIATQPNPWANEGWEAYADWEQGLAAWSAGHFPEAVAALESHLDTWTEHSQGHYYLGLSRLELGEDQAAIPHLQMARLNDTLLYHDATWHLALTYLKMEQVSDAIALLAELYQGHEPLYRQKADVILHQWLHAPTPSEGIH